MLGLNVKILSCAYWLTVTENKCDIYIHIFMHAAQILTYGMRFGYCHFLTNESSLLQWVRMHNSSSRHVSWTFKWYLTKKCCQCDILQFLVPLVMSCNLCMNKTEDGPDTQKAGTTRCEVQRYLAVAGASSDIVSPPVI